MRVGIIDSGMHKSLLLSERASLSLFSSWSLEISAQGTQVVGRVSEPEDIARWWLREGGADPCWDTCGHGSLMVRTILDSGRDLELLMAQVLDERGRGREPVLLGAWAWLLEQNPQVINFSLGCHPENGAPWEVLAERSRRKGVKLFAAAGSSPCYPACLDGVVPVADERLQEDPALEDHWRNRIRIWVPQSSLPSWNEGSSSASMACAAAVRDYIKGA